MTTISAKIIADSEAPNGSRLTTMQLRYPRWIHAEFMTHRVFSRNASSSRAIPVARLIADVESDPAVPLFWGKNQKGMQADEECSAAIDLVDEGVILMYPREYAWLEAKRHAVDVAKAFDKAGYHKQLVNRLLEPFSHINVVVSATEWDNFFALRDHNDAEPHIHILAAKMRKVMAESKPRRLEWGQWHLPYVDLDNVLWESQKSVGLAVQCSAARCARVSYLTHDGKKPDTGKDLELFKDLAESHPAHASPMEHQATPILRRAVDGWSVIPNGVNGNFNGAWAQHRKLLEAGGIGL